MPDVVIENPILNSPFVEPRRHFAFGETGITDEVVDARRVSSYFMPIAAARKTGQIQFETEWTRDRIEENQFINRVRERIALWRMTDWSGVTPVTRRLLEHWTKEDRERRLFFCQVEALETAVYLAECATKQGDAWILNDLRRFADDANPGLLRLAFKMATGSGKTVVMAMLIAWQTLNKRANPRDGRFSDAFLVVAPGITIRDRLRVLLPQDPDNYYRVLDLVPPGDRDRLGEARIVVTNFHAFQPRETVAASRTTKQILTAGRPSPFTESPDQIVRRVLRELGTKRNIVVLNDEAHHCYRRRAGGGSEGDGVVTDEVPERLTSEDRREAERRDEEARVWVSGLEAVARKLGVRAVYDLSATPFYLRGSGWPEGTLFQWVVSDFSLIDAIESGIVKVPRVPVADNAMAPGGPTYRELWSRIREELPRGNRKATGVVGEPRLPAELQGALHSLYSNYEQAFRRWKDAERADPRGSTPPVFIVVCANTSVSKLVFDYIAGWERTLPDEAGGGTVVVPGELPLFSNEADGRWRDSPFSTLVDSAQLESGAGMSDEFKAVAQREIEEFKADYRLRYPGRDVDGITDEDLLREVMNTVGKPGKLGEHVRCVVSVSMLTEGWDANTVTQILGVRAFGSQLLCEQVVGRGLRRMSYVPNDDERFEPEYAEVYGVPFSFIPSAGPPIDPKPPRLMTRVRALPERANLEITFPRIVGYRHELSGERLTWLLGDEHRLALSTADVPTSTELAPIVGARDVHTLDDLRARREQEVVYFLARRTTGRFFADRPWLFPQLVVLAREWLDRCVAPYVKDDAFPQLLLLHERADAAAELLYHAIVAADPGRPRLLAVPAPYEPVGSTAVVGFDTSKQDLWRTRADRCHVDWVVGDSGWETKLAQSLEDMPDVRAYVKNQGLGFTIPYTIDAEQRQYVPDFLVVCH